MAQVQLAACPLWPGTAERCLPQTSQAVGEDGREVPGAAVPPPRGRGKASWRRGGSCSRSKPGSGGGRPVGVG